MAEDDGASSPEQRHTGVIRRSDLTRPRRSTARQDWLALVAVATLMVIVLVVVANFFGGKPGNPDSSPSLVANATATPTLKPTYTAEPTRTPVPTPTPTPSPTASPSPRPSPTPTPSPTPAPTAPTFGLVILEPANGTVSRDRVIMVRGLSQPNARIVREVPWWFDQTSDADGAGSWSMVVELNVGENQFVFRVGDDPATRVIFSIRYTPA